MRHPRNWLLAFAALAMLPLAGCVVNDHDGAHESTDGDSVVVDEGTELQCTGHTEDQGDEQVGFGECELEEEGA